MRKADYFALADEIRNKLNEAEGVANPHIRAYVMNLLDELARDLAQRLSVDRAAFLTACGLKP